MRSVLREPLEPRHATNVCHCTVAIYSVDLILPDDPRPIKIAVAGVGPRAVTRANDDARVILKPVVVPLEVAKRLRGAEAAPNICQQIAVPPMVMTTKVRFQTVAAVPVRPRTRQPQAPCATRPATVLRPHCYHR